VLFGLCYYYWRWSPTSSNTLGFSTDRCLDSRKTTRDVEGQIGRKRRRRCLVLVLQLMVLLVFLMMLPLEKSHLGNLF
jgi:hypothetical protein